MKNSEFVKTFLDFYGECYPIPQFLPTGIVVTGLASLLFGGGYITGAILFLAATAAFLVLLPSLTASLKRFIQGNQEQD